jgi:hypothetical protein
MTIEQQKLVSANRIMNSSPMILGNLSPILLQIQKLLPKHYLVSLNNDKKSINCVSLIDKGITDNEWDEFKPKAKSIIGNSFLEFYSNICTNHLDFIIYVK